MYKASITVNAFLSPMILCFPILSKSCYLSIPLKDCFFLEFLSNSSKLQSVWFNKSFRSNLLGPRSHVSNVRTRTVPLNLNNLITKHGARHIAGAPDMCCKEIRGLCALEESIYRPIPTTKHMGQHVWPLCSVLWEFREGRGADSGREYVPYCSFPLECVHSLIQSKVTECCSG